MDNINNIINSLQREFSELRFIDDDDKHEYLLNGSKPIPVSSIIKLFYEQFNANRNAKRVANKRGVPMKSILAEWRKINKTSIKLGNETHQFGEDYAYWKYFNSSDKSEPKPTTSHQLGVVGFWEELPNHIVPVSLELKMFSRMFNFAGTCDILLYNTQTDKFIIGDYKTNKDIFKNFMGKKMYPPYEYLLDMPYNHYQLQLSLYQIMLEEAGYEVEDRWLIWILPEREGNYKTYNTNDFRQSLKEFLHERNRRHNTKSTKPVL